MVESALLASLRFCQPSKSVPILSSPTTSAASNASFDRASATTRRRASTSLWDEAHRSSVGRGLPDGSRMPTRTQVSGRHPRVERAARGLCCPTEVRMPHGAAGLCEGGERRPAPWGPVPALVLPEDRACESVVFRMPCKPGDILGKDVRLRHGPGRLEWLARARGYRSGPRL